MAETAAKLELVASVRDQMTRTFRAMQTGAVKFVDGVRKKFNEWAKDLFGIRGLIAGVATFMGSRALLNSVRNIAEVARETGNWADRLGIAVEELDALEFAASQYGVTNDAVRDGLKTLQEKLTDAAEGSATLRKRLADLGVNGFDPVTGKVRNAVDLIADLSSAFQRLQSEGRGADLFKIAADLFGGKAGGLQTLLTQGPDKLGAAIAPALQLGVITQNQVRIARLVAASFEIVDRAVRNVKLSLLEAFGPDIVAALKTFASLVGDNREKIVEFVRDVGTLAVTALRTAANITITIVRGILDAIDFVQSKISDVKDGFTTLKDLVLGGPFYAGGKAQARGEAQRASGTEDARRQLGELESQAGSAGKTFDDFVTTYSERFGRFRRAAVSEMQGVAQDAEHAAEQTTSAWDAYFDGFSEGLSNWKEELKDFHASGVQAGRDVFQAVRSGLEGFIAASIKGTERFKDAWKGMLRSILDDWISVVSKLTAQSLLSGLFGGLFGGGVPLIPGGSGSVIPGGSGITPGITPNALGGGTPLGSPIVVNLQVSAIDTRSGTEFLAQHKNTLAVIVSDMVRSNTTVKSLVRRR